MATSTRRKDVAWWQHVNFSALSFGSDGVLDATNQKATLAAIVGGTQSWPDLTNPWNPTHPLGNGVGAVAVDDLWHAAVMARGRSSTRNRRSKCPTAWPTSSRASRTSARRASAGR